MFAYRVRRPFALLKGKGGVAVEMLVMVQITLFWVLVLAVVAVVIYFVVKAAAKKGVAEALRDYEKNAGSGAPQAPEA